MISHLQMKIRQMLWSIQEPLGLQIPGVYKSLCTCETCHIGQTGHSVTVRWKDHQSHLRWGHVDKSALADHGWKIGHAILFGQTEILHKSDHWGSRVTRETLGLLLPPNSLTKEVGANLSAVWLPACELLQGRQSQDSDTAKTSS